MPFLGRQNAVNRLWAATRCRGQEGSQQEIRRSRGDIPQVPRATLPMSI